MSSETGLIEELHRELKEDGHRVLLEACLKEPTGSAMATAALQKFSKAVDEIN
jgi:hypothetical protein